MWWQNIMFCSRKKQRWKPQELEIAVLLGLDLWTRFNASGLIGIVFVLLYIDELISGQLSELLVYTDIWWPDIRIAFCKDRWCHVTSCHHDWLIQRNWYPQPLWLADHNTEPLFQPLPTVNVCITIMNPSTRNQFKSKNLRVQKPSNTYQSNQYSNILKIVYVFKIFHSIMKYHVAGRILQA